MPRIRARNQRGERRVQGHLRHSLGEVDTAADARTKHARRLFQRGSAGGGRRRCPSCGFEVRTNADGGLGAHRVGPDTRRSWPCRGEDEGTP